MALAALGAFSVFDIFVLGTGGALTSFALLVPSFGHIKRYLDSGKLIDLVPANATESKALLVQTGVGDLTAVDGILVGSSTTGLTLLLLSPKLRLAGGLALLSSFFWASQRDNAKLIGVSSAAIAATIANPVQAMSTGLALLGVITNATVNGISSAFQLSTTAIGVLVTASGAVVGYVLTKDQ